MRPHSVRLLLAGRLRLGEPIRTPLPLTDESRHIALDSTLNAWKQIQTSALDRKVDTVVLNGETVVADRLTPVAEHALLEGLEFLGEAGIPVLIQPSETDPLSFWKRVVSELPQHRHITVVTPQTSSEFWLVEENSRRFIVTEYPDSHEEQNHQAQTIARFVSISSTSSNPQNERNESIDDRQLPVIHIEPDSDESLQLRDGVDLKLTPDGATWKNDEYQSVRQDRCGAPQPLSREEAERYDEAGCLLIEIPTRGAIQTERLSTAAVRFHTTRLDLTECDDWDDAALSLQNQLEDLAWEPYERLRLVTWSVATHDPLSTQLLNGDDSHLIAAWNNAFASHHHDTIVIHGFQPAGQLPLDLESACSGRELAEALTEIEQSADQPEVDRLAAVWATDLSSASLLTELRPVLNPAQIGAYAESVMTQWLTQSDPENLPHENYSS
ncbi:MAG: hypothetical protein HUJ26_13850 [Planctomycetaceae bacterium]|nr:hypothetical protein [Planctomycetaceae bacterium]